MLGRLSPFYFVWPYILLKLDIEKWSRNGKREDLLAGQGFLSVCFFKPNRNNYIEIETALDLTKYLAEEDEILVWFEVLVNLINRDVISDVNNYAIYPLLKVISCFVMWLLNQPSLPLSVFWPASVRQAFPKAMLYSFQMLGDLFLFSHKWLFLEKNLLAINRSLEMSEGEAWQGFTFLVKWGWI